MKKLISVAILLLASTIPGTAQIAVVDVASVRQQIQQLLQMQKELVQLQQMYALYQQQFNLLNAEAQSLKGLPNRYRYTFANWQQFVAGNQYGNTNNWASGITTGDANSIQTGFRNLLPTIQPVDVTATPQAQQDWRQQYGLMQLQDASLMTGIKTIGDLRNNMQQNTRVLAQLEADATSSDPSLQSAKALQQKALVAMLLMIHTLQDTNRALASSIDLEVQTLAQQRWERGRELNATARDRQGR
ncbi:MAG: hypothetical protein LAO78_12055 [Acidobacteriia bacterium]|jgi:hypothetical protein|nr:hypothetical protein [Terriglobia bacterium]